jgi:hypothetical protein
MIVTFKETAAIVAISMWSALSVIRQLYPRKPHWLSVIDICSLVPSWRFFGPKPTTSDLHLLLSYKKRGVTVESVDITPYYPRSILSAVWNPRRRLRKSMASLARVLRVAPARSRRYRSAEMILAAYATSLPRSVYGRRRRFDLVSRPVNMIDSTEECVFKSDEYVYKVRS